MSKFRVTIKVLAIATFMFATVSIAQAQASRTWVSGVGDDANPCSRTAPCKTLAGAYFKTAAKAALNVTDGAPVAGRAASPWWAHASAPPPRGAPPPPRGLRAAG